MKYMIMIVALILPLIMKAQLPIGKDKEGGVSALKSILEDKGQTFFKSKDAVDNAGVKSVYLLYKEEFTVSVTFNKFENIESIHFSTGREEAKKMIENIVEYDKWRYHSSWLDNFSRKKIIDYRIHNYFARYFYNPESRKYPDGKDLVYQFILFRK